jgi:Na+/H+ antiporter NhaD/arsenite permease-like protein
VALVALAVVFVGTGAAFLPSMPPMEEPLGKQMPIGFAIPFVLLLLAIAILPAASRRWWHSDWNKAKVVVFFSLPVVVLFAYHFGDQGGHALRYQAMEYASFVILLAALYVISGGILIEGAFGGTPGTNTILLGTGAVLANVIGTTGAALLLVRPLIRSNIHRHRIAHVLVFFIFVVANCGGLLTPLGDPPLFLGYLKGVPFEWTLRLFPQWLFVNGALLGLFFVWDRIEWSRNSRELLMAANPTRNMSFGIRGAHNFGFLAAVVALLFAAGHGYGNAGMPWRFGWQEAGLVALAVASFFSTRPEIRAQNNSTFRPIIEIAILFAGIFITITPATLWLDAHGDDLGLSKPWHFFWASGLMSSMLDNAPAYLASVAAACGLRHVPLEGQYLANYLHFGEASDQILSAIACGCVFFGALTYLGNAPNFVVRAIAEESNVRMPSFFGFMIYSLPVLLPLFGLVTLIFLRG